MPRLAPTLNSIKKLYALAGNSCAFPGCSNKIVSKDGLILGEICHIEAANFTGPRFNENSNDEQRRDYDNLILLCSNCHIIIDNDSQYSVDLLRRIKENHESKSLHSNVLFSDEIGENLIKKLIAQPVFKNLRGNQINAIGDSIIQNINIEGTNSLINSIIDDRPLPFKYLDETFWKGIISKSIDYEKYILNLNSEEQTICCAIVNGLAGKLDYVIESDYERINDLEWEIKDAIQNGFFKKVILSSASGSGKTTLLYEIAYSYYKTVPVIKIIKPLKEQIEFIADYGLIILDEITDHLDYLINYHEYLISAFPKGFVFLIADQLVVWNSIELNRKFLRQSDSISIKIVLKESILHSIYVKLENLFLARDKPEIVLELRKGKMKFLDIQNEPNIPIADRLIELYFSTGLIKSKFRKWIKPDWETLVELKEGESLRKLYRLVAYVNLYYEDFDLRLLGTDKQKYLELLTILNNPGDGLPLQFTNSKSSKLRLRHNRLAKWFFNENPADKVIAESFICDIYKKKSYSVEEIILLRKLHQKGATEILKVLNWDNNVYYERLMTYYRENIGNDFENQARKTEYEALKTLFSIDRSKYDKIIAEKINNLNSRKWIYSIEIKNLIQNNEIDLALQKIGECKEEEWFESMIGNHALKAYFKKAMAVLQDETVDLFAFCIKENYPLVVILKIAKSLTWSTSKHKREASRKLFSYFVEQYDGVKGNFDKRLEELILPFVKLLIFERKFENAIDLIAKTNYHDYPYLMSHLGYALMQMTDTRKYAELGEANLLIYNAFCKNPSDVSTLQFLSLVFNKSRISFTDVQLQTLQQELKLLILDNAYPLYSKILSSITRKLNNFDEAENILRSAIYKYPVNDHLKFELIELLLGKYGKLKLKAITSEINDLMQSVIDKESNYYKIILVKYYQSMSLIVNNILRKTYNDSALSLARELEANKEFSSAGRYLLVKSLYYTFNYKECIEVIRKHYFENNIYDDYEINDWFYYSILKDLNKGVESFVVNCKHYNDFIEKLFEDKSYETNDYFKYLVFIVNKHYRDSEKREEFEKIKNAIKKDSQLSINFILLRRIITFLFETNHYNSIHNLINFIRKGDTSKAQQVNLPADIIFHYRSCGLISNNRIFISKPEWEERPDNLVIFPMLNSLIELKSLIDTYLKVFDKLSYKRRKIVFLVCLIRTYNNDQELILNLIKVLKKELEQLFNYSVIEEGMLNERGTISKTDIVGTFNISNSKCRYTFRSEKLIEKILEDKTKNWSYFSINKKKEVQNLETGFVIDGYHDFEIDFKSTLPIKPLRMPQGLYFDKWLEITRPSNYFKLIK